MGLTERTTRTSPQAGLAIYLERGDGMAAGRSRGLQNNRFSQQRSPPLRLVGSPDSGAPAVNAAAVPTALWPPKREPVNVAIHAFIEDQTSGVTQVLVEVVDEYNGREPLVAPVNIGGDTSFDLRTEFELLPRVGATTCTYGPWAGTVRADCAEHKSATEAVYGPEGSTNE